MQRFSKILVLTLFLGSSLGSASAYELDQARSPEFSQKIRAHLIINSVDRRLEIEFANRTIRENISIERSAIRGALSWRDEPLSYITVTPKNRSDGTTGLQIRKIEYATGTLDSFRSVEKMLREYQKERKLQEFYTSFIRTIDIPSSYTIPDLPFQPQAPLITKENWAIHEESCEEASILLNHYITNQISFTPEQMNVDIIAMNEFQKTHGIPENKYSTRYQKYFLRDLTDPSEMYDLLGKQYFAYRDDQILMVRHPSIATLERFIRSNVVLTVPMKYTDVLRNNYIRVGKTFHIINLVGYTRDTFITLDPGTKNGRYLSYPKELLYKSIQENGDYFIALKKK